MTEAFLSRWSKRKQGQPLETSVEAAESQPPAQVQSEEAIQEPAEKELTDADMPDLESLDGQSDVSMFFSEGVSKALRQKALKQLFHQPSFNVTVHSRAFCPFHQPSSKVASHFPARGYFHGQKTSHTRTVANSD